ncbi:MAG: phosphoribosyltransferase, partial [Cytophagales bacterium]|nr:phosphoribosyltransferase [Cytophagales bacterium]
MTQEKILILNNKQVVQKIKRIAYEIYEHNFEEKEIVLAGIYDKGYTLASLLKSTLEQIAPFSCQLVKITLDKSTPLQSE